MKNYDTLRPKILIDDFCDGGWGYGATDWEYDSRGNDGAPSPNVERKLNTINGMPSVLKREVNIQESGIITTELIYSIYEGEGFYFRFHNADNTLLKIIYKNGAFYMGDKKLFAVKYGRHYMKIILDLDKSTFEVISDTEYTGKYNIVSDISSFNYLSCGFDKGSNGSAGLYYLTKMYTNYYLNDYNVWVAETKTLPYGYTKKSVGKANAYISKTGDNHFDYSLTLEAKKDSNVCVEKYFDKTNGNVTFDIKYIAWDKNGKLGIGLYNNDTPCVEVYDNGTEFFCKSGLFRKHIFNVWQFIRIEVNFINKTALVYSNGKKQSVISLENVDLSSINNLKFTVTSENGKPTKSSFAEMFVFPNLPEPEDYVPEPVIPKKKGDYAIGMNVCSLWRQGMAFGWEPISSFKNPTPLMGFYDEGRPETADWEIKFMAEHGVDFQLYCWYANQHTYPIRDRNSHIHQGHMYAKYSDKVKFSLILCLPGHTFETFKNVYVPLWLDYYFNDDRFMSIDNKAVISAFTFGASEANAKAELDYLRSEVKKLGYDDLIVLYCDASTKQGNIDAGFTAMQAYAWGTRGYDMDLTKRLIMKNYETKVGHVVPTVSVGYNRVPWHGTRTPHTKPEEMKETLEWVRDEMLPKFKSKKKEDAWKSKFVIMSTWNEFGEGTYINPCGLYGFAYLDAIRSVFCEDVPHIDVIPSEHQKDRIGDLYPKGRGFFAKKDEIEPDTSKLKLLYKFDFKSKKDLEKWEMSGFTAEIKDGKLIGTANENDPYMAFYFDKPIDIDKVYYITVKTKAFKTGQNMCISTAYLLPESADGWDKKFETPIWFTDPDKFLNMRFKVFSVKRSGKVKAFRFDPIFNQGGFEIENIAIYEAPKHSSIHIDDVVYNFPVLSHKFGDEVYFAFDRKHPFANRKELFFDWNNKNKVLYLYGVNEAVFTVGSDVCLVDGKEFKLPKEIELVDGLPYIPVSVYAHVLGYKYELKHDDVYLYTSK